jgi:hypothetical protein
MSEAVIISSILGGCGLIITIIYNYKNTQLANHKMQKELFTEFNKRYNELNDNLNLLSSSTLEDFSNWFLPEDRVKIKATIYDFFNLCSEEYYWKNEGRIPKKVWKSWERGMNDIYNRSEVIKTMWEEECQNNGFISYYIDKKDAFFKLR